MPTYSYRCTECGEAFDIQQAFTDDTLTVCPNCGGQLRKLFNTVGVTFNGSGFYRTDSRAKPAVRGSAVVIRLDRRRIRVVRPDRRRVSVRGIRPRHRRLAKKESKARATSAKE